MNGWAIVLLSILAFIEFNLDLVFAMCGTFFPFIVGYGILLVFWWLAANPFDQPIIKQIVMIIYDMSLFVLLCVIGYYFVIGLGVYYVWIEDVINSYLGIFWLNDLKHAGDSYICIPIVAFFIELFAFCIICHRKS